jgi:hypothetical protein
MSLQLQQVPTTTTSMTITETSTKIRGLRFTSQKTGGYKYDLSGAYQLRLSSDINNSHFNLYTLYLFLNLLLTAMNYRNLLPLTTTFKISDPDHGTTRLLISVDSTHRTHHIDLNYICQFVIIPGTVRERGLSTAQSNNFEPP